MNEITGTIVLDTFETVQFQVWRDPRTGEAHYNQWGAPTATLGRTVDAVQAIADALVAEVSV